MNKSLKIGKREAVALLIIAITYKLYLGYLSVITSMGGSAAWMIVLLSGLLSLALFGLIFKFLERFPDQTFPETVETIVGPWLGIPIMLIFLSNWLYDVATILRRTAEIMISTTLPNTPLSFIALFMVLAASIGAYFGLKQIAGVAYLSFPFIGGALVIVILSMAYRWEVSWLFPILGKGLDQVAIHGVIHTGDYFEFSLIYALPLYFYRQQIKDIGLQSIAVSTLILLMAILSYIMAFTPTIGQEPYAPLFNMARMIYLSRFLQRIELLFVIFWIVSACIWFSTGFFGLSFLLARWLKLPDYRPLLLPCSILILSVAFIPDSLPAATGAYQKYRHATAIGLYGWPALLLLIAVVRKKGVKPNEGK